MTTHPADRSPGDFNVIAALMLGALLALLLLAEAKAAPAGDETMIAALDTEYQAAVEKNDATTMDRILADDFVLVNGRGRAHTKNDLLESARKKNVVYELQVEEPGTQKVRLWGDTAVLTALLRIKGVSNGQPIDIRLWFSDTYVRTAAGWKYVFGQSSLPLPKDAPQPTN